MATIFDELAHISNADIRRIERVMQKDIEALEKMDERDFAWSKTLDKAGHKKLSKFYKDLAEKAKELSEEYMSLQTEIDERKEM
jgi:hypothetical protein